ncbi:MAG TPA: SDR family NAD(P)-dependent oxidoreductase [Puia sp.]|jgi:NAD(P)-dependent dehydrogenase (short-subunit alcohol dehydrogenase family)
MQNTKVWFVTGASKGLGLALVRLLLSSGHKVAATSRNIGELEKAVGGEAPAGGQGNLLPLQVDITKDESVKEAVRESVGRFGRLDVVVNNAGYSLFGSMEEVSESEFRQSLDVNVAGPVNLIRAVMPYLREQRSGHVINISSLAGYKGFGNAASYCMAKFAIVGLSESLAEEAKAFGIKVTVVAPGYFRTSFLDRGSLVIAKNRVPEYNGDELIEMMKQMDGNQAGDPDKLVKALVRIVEDLNPPVHLLMGPDAYQVVVEKRKVDETEMEAWKEVTVNTNFL